MEIQERHELGPRPSPGLDHRRILRRPVLGEGLELGLGGADGRRGVDPFQVLGDGLPVLPRRIAETVADQMNVMPTSA